MTETTDPSTKRRHRSEADLLHVMTIKGFATSESIASAIGLQHDVVSELLTLLLDKGLVSRREKPVPGWGLSPEGREQNRRDLEALRTPALTSALDLVYDRFLRINRKIKDLCTRWQESSGRDAAERWKLVEELADIHRGVERTLRDAAQIVPGFDRYAIRLANAIAAIDAGDDRYFTHPLVDSYHTVWFECHQDFLVTLGRERTDEDA